MSLILPQRFTQQPQQAVAIAPFWLAQGLVDVIDMTGKPRSMILGTPASNFGTTPKFGTPCERGRALDTSAAFGGVYFQRSDGAYSGAEQTHVAVARYNSATGTYAGLFVVADGSGANNGFSLQAASSGADLLTYAGGTGNTLTGAGTAIIGTGFSVVGLSGGSNYAELFRNGKSVAAITGVTLPAYSTSRLILFGERTASASYSTKGMSALHLVFKTRLSPALHQVLAANPWQVFARPAQNIWVPVSAGSGSIVTTITGGATASAAGAQLNVSMLAGVGSASAQGVAATLSCAIQTTTGAATAQGVAAALNASIQTTAAGVFAQGVASNILHGVTVQAAAGNATAQGAAANLNSVIQTTTVSAFAQGVSASLSGALTISTVAGNATAVGQASLLNTSIVCSVGNASAAIATALIESGASILTTAGGVSAQGIVAAINTSIATIPAGAVAQGVTGGISTPFSTLVYCFTGQGEAVGVPAIVFPGVLVLERVEVMSRLLVTSEQKSRLNQIIFKGSCIH